MPTLSCSLHVIWRAFILVANLRWITLKSGGPNPAWGHFSEWVSRTLIVLVFWPPNRQFRKTEQGPPPRVAFFGRVRIAIAEYFKSFIPLLNLSGYLKTPNLLKSFLIAEILKYFRIA